MDLCRFSIILSLTRRQRRRSRRSIWGAAAVCQRHSQGGCVPVTLTRRLERAPLTRRDKASATALFSFFSSFLARERGSKNLAGGEKFGRRQTMHPLCGPQLEERPALLHFRQVCVAGGKRTKFGRRWTSCQHTASLAGGNSRQKFGRR